MSFGLNFAGISTLSLCEVFQGPLVAQLLQARAWYSYSVKLPLSLTLCFWVFSGVLFRYTYPCLHNQPLQVRSYSVKFPLSPFRCCQAWYSYNVKSFLSLTLCFWVLAWYSYSVKVFFLLLPANKYKVPLTPV